MTNISLISRNEAAELSGASASAVNKAIEQKLIRTRSSENRKLIEPTEVAVLAFLAGTGGALPTPYKRRVGPWLRGTKAVELEVAPGVVLKRTERVEQALENTRRYLQWRTRFVSLDPEIRGGEPVITGTRVPIRTVAQQLQLGERLETLREEYPHIPVEAYEFVPLWAHANPRRGRPARPRRTTSARRRRAAAPGR